MEQQHHRAGSSSIYVTRFPSTMHSTQTPPFTRNRHELYHIPANIANSSIRNYMQRPALSCLSPSLPVSIGRPGPE